MEIGRLWLESGNKELAEKYLLHAVNKNPKNLKNKLMLADLLQEAEKYDQAITLLQPMLVEEPLNPDLLFKIATNYFKSGEFSKAAKFLERLRLVNQDDTRSLNLLAEAHMQLGNAEKAKEIWRLSLEKDPEQEEIKQKLGTIEDPH